MDLGLLTRYGSSVGLLAMILLMVLVCLAVRAIFSGWNHPRNLAFVFSAIVLIAGLWASGIL